MFAHPLPTGCGRDHKPSTDLFDNPMTLKPDAKGKGFTVTSLGRDGKPGGSGTSADVVVKRE